MPLGAQPGQTLLRPRASLLHQEIQSPGVGSSPVPSCSSSHVPVPLVQLQTPDGPLQVPVLPGSSVPDVGVLDHTSEEKGCRASREDEWCGRRVGSPSNIKVHGLTGGYLPVLQLRSVHSPHGETEDVRLLFPSSRFPKPVKDGKCPAKGCC